MTTVERYELILRQAIRECPVIPTEDAPATPYEELEARAPFLADILYRLALEHGVPWNSFRDETLRLITTDSTIRVPTKDQKTGTRRFASDLSPTHPLIVLALEMMPPDGY